MRAWRLIIAGLLAALALVALVPGAAGARATLRATTRANLVAAAKGEAFAHAKYLAYAEQARRVGHPVVARLFARTAATEFGDHFLKVATMGGVIGGNAQNLRDAIAGEGSEHTTIYPGFAAQARARGDTAAAAMWTEFAKDEGTHLGNFEQALKAITRPSSGAKVPAGPRVEPFSIVPGPPKAKSRVTLANLFTTLRGEAWANARYLADGRKAQRTGQPRLARLWRRTADIERLEHFAETATMAGLVRDTATDLRDAIRGEIGEATTVYVRYARQARAAGDRAAARLFAELARDEAGHAAAFVRVLQQLELPR
jgi:rubrerythrin